MRAAVPAHLPVSAKMRLGTESNSQAEECALALAEGGAGEIVVHARTKRDGYRPPAYWERIADLRRVVPVPLVANGEIWTVDDALRCQQVSGCENLMLGRGMVADPGLALALRVALGETVRSPLGGPHAVLDWPHLVALLKQFWTGVERHITPRHRPGRLKQWLNFLRRRFPEAEAAYQQLRTVNEPAAMRQALYSLG